jgi:hypothetical protein
MFVCNIAIRLRAAAFFGSDSSTAGLRLAKRAAKVVALPCPKEEEETFPNSWSTGLNQDTSRVTTFQ